jgi:aspartate carbamoyltransferase catalytic subunit
MTFVSAPALKMKDDIKAHLAEKSVPFTETENITEAMETADVVYQTRVQKERFPSEEEYLKFKGSYVIDRPMADHMKDGAILIHPLPRAGEIALEVDDSPHAVYFRQAGYGVLVRMALLKLLLG